MRKRENVHSTAASPQAYISAVCVCVHTCQCFFFFSADVTLCVFVVWIQLSGWCVKSLTASLRLVRTGRQRHPRKGERGEDRDVGQAGFTVGPVRVSWAVSRRERWENRGQLLSLLMSTHFFHQLSIYRPVLHFVPSIHRHTRTHTPERHKRLQVIPQRNSQ